VEPFILEDNLWLSTMWQSRKAADLLRDDRVLVHSLITSKEGGLGEVKLRGRAFAVEDPERRRRYCDAVTVLGWRPEEPYFHLFRIDVDDVTFIRYGSNGDQFVTRWPDPREYVWRATSATSVGAPEPHRDLLA
jgi:hypothetical protein